MSELSIDLHKQTAYQRWEMAPLTQTRQSRAGTSSLSDIRLTQELERARQTGYQQGYQEGLQQGRTEGIAQGLVEGRVLIAEQQSALQNLMTEFELQLTHARENIAQQVLTLALDMTHAMLKSALEVQPERILPLIEQTLQSLPAIKSTILLYLHPQDLELLVATQGEKLTTQGWLLRADPQLLRGGCRVETPANEIDASLPTRWLRLQQALGQQSNWLTPY